MKILYYGGQKSGKSLLAEERVLEMNSTQKPYYIATYHNTYDDSEMQERILQHQSQRAEKFVSIEEPLALSRRIKEGESHLIDCLSMWILNTLDLPIEELFVELESLAEVEADVVFVLNDVTSGVIPIDKESRKFVDRTGVIGQRIAQMCDEVYEVKLGLGVRLK
jgi:adenosylcobinamide kinase/adenosylcobinamide-phosphate guanylyltransferase